jgi:hypothetical protein
MQFRFEVLPKQSGMMRLKCFYGTGSEYAEFYVGFDFRRGVGEFFPKDSFYAQVLSRAFTKAMATQ